MRVPTLKKIITYCMNLDRQPLNLSEDAHLHAPFYEAWK
jgi:hypothetical protein